MVVKACLVLVLILAVGTASAAASRPAPTPRQLIAQAQAYWLKEMRLSASSGDRSPFPSPPRAVLMSRLRRAAQLYDFRIASVHIFHPLQSAPTVVIRSDRKLATARATPKIIFLFDPYHVTSANPYGYAYEGYFLVAETSKGVPYLFTFSHLRAPHSGGGEWAANEKLYPFPHG